MSIQRGQVVMVWYPYSHGVGGKVRPALVIQCDKNNRRLNSTIVAQISSTTRRSAVESTQLLIDPASPEGHLSGLLHPSAVKCENLVTVLQERIVRTIGRVDQDVMNRVNRCIKASLDVE
jgi:mRNA interferase MazF